MRKTHVSSLALCLLLAACFGGTTTPDDGQTTSSAMSSEAVTETRNVTYRGTVEELGVTIYQQGTHRLTLGDGRMILLESTAVNLETYLNHEVEAFGAIRPSVEAGGIIMRVERITDLSGDEASSMPASARSSMQASSVRVSSAAAAVSSPRPSSASQQTSSQTTASPAPGLDARIAVMASHDVSAGNWTQRYCTEHISFCIPMHKNWWFRSFGTTSSTLWHVEASTEDFETIGTGPITIDLVGGESPQADGTVVVSGNTVVGYRTWTQGRHFEIRADSRLEAAVRYMTAELEATEMQ